MYKDYEVYKIALKVLDDVTNSIVKCQKKIIKFHQDHIDEIKNDYTISEEVKNKKIEEYLRSISTIHSLLRDNNGIINLINEKIEELNNNLNNIIINEEALTNSKSVSEVTSTLRNIVSNECNKIYALANEAKTLLETINNNENMEKRKDLEIECQRLYHLADEIKSMLNGISFNVDKQENNSEFEITINKAVEEEEKRVTFISQEAEKILNSNLNAIFNNNGLEPFCNIIKDEYKKLSIKSESLKKLENDINRKEPTVAFKVSLSLLQEVVEEEQRRILSSLNKLEILLEKEKLTTAYNEQNIVFENAEEEEHENISKVIDEESQRLEDYSNKLRDILKDLKDGKSNAQQIISQISNSYTKETSNMDKAIDKALAEDKIKQKEKDTIEYKKYCTVLNKSFWEARQQASKEKIKYPSSLYEQKVNEYQNTYLVNNYNITLEQVNKSIEEYKEKYAEDLYIDEIYYRALFQLRDETSLSIQQLCDETTELSMMDKRVYMLLEEDLVKIIKEISLAKEEENIDNSLDVTEYKNSVTLNKLLDQKTIIEHQMDIIQKRAKKISEKDN